MKKPIVTKRTSIQLSFTEVSTVDGGSTVIRDPHDVESN